MWVRLYIVAMITSIDVSQEIFAMDILKALKSYLKQHRKHVLRLLQLYGDQALTLAFSVDFFKQARYKQWLRQKKELECEMARVKHQAFILDLPAGIHSSLERSVKKLKSPVKIC